MLSQGACWPDQEWRTTPETTHRSIPAFQSCDTINRKRTPSTHSVTNMPSPNDSWNAGLESLLPSVLQRVLRTESPRILLTRGESENWVPQPLLLPRADIVELSEGVNFLEDMEDHLCKQRPLDSLLMLPPLVSRHSLPSDFRRRHPRRSLHEVALERVLALVPVGTCIADTTPSSALRQ